MRKTTKAPTTDPGCPNRLHHFSGNRCPVCGGVGLWQRMNTVEPEWVRRARESRLPVKVW